MMQPTRISMYRGLELGVLVLALTLTGCQTPAGQVGEQEIVASHIIQASDLETARAAVELVGGIVTHELGIIGAVGASLTVAQREALDRSHYELSASRNSTLETSGWSGGDVTYVDFPGLVDADRLHEEGIDGFGQTVAIVDSGFMYTAELQRRHDGTDRLLARYNAIDPTKSGSLDKYGHGSHVASIILNSSKPLSDPTKFNSIAPEVDVVTVKAFAKNGTGTYANVIRGLDWIYTNKDVYSIDVVNLSFSAPPRSFYWEDPLNQAVMRLWQAGIVVVASAGNGGPDAMTIGAPGNVPYVITVGAMTDNYTPVDGSDDVLASFSAAGPTYEGFVKPEMLAPGGHMTGLSRVKSTLANDHPDFHDQEKYFVMSGTSQAAAVVTGTVALLLQAEPWLTPDDVKCRLMASARPAVDGSGDLAYSIFQQGTGLVNAYDAVYGTASGCANQGLDIDKDLAGDEHFGGPANQDEEGNFYIMGLEGYLWANGYLWADGYLWANGYLWADGYLWANGYLWADGYLWANGYLWADGYLWSNSLTERATANVWVEQE